MAVTKNSFSTVAGWLLRACALSLVLFSGSLGLSAATPGAQTTADVTKLLKDSQGLISNFWQINDFRLRFEAGDIPTAATNEDSQFVKDYLATLDRYNETVKRVAGKLIRDFSLTSDTFLNFSAFYKSNPGFLKEALDPVVKVLVVNYKQIAPSADHIGFLAEYFPGYGYGDPEYRYRKGKELSREFLYARWLEESQVITQSKQVELTVEVSLVAGIKEKFPDAQTLGSPFPVEIGGKIVMAVKITWMNSTQTTTRTKKKIGHYKIWFELHRAKKSWSSPQWELCGKTYENLEEATGEEVTIGISFK